MRTETLVQPAITWLKERPSLAHEQLENPVFSLLRAKEEIDELIEAIVGGNREDIKQELADVFNFIACAEWIILKTYLLTEQELVDEGKAKYLRNHTKYPAAGYQNGTPPKVQLKRDANNWAFASTFEGADPTQILAGENY